MVVMSIEQYKCEAERQLSDQDTYSRLTGGPTKKYKMWLTNLVNDAVSLGIFDQKLASSLIPEFPASPIFHHLPKTHKGLHPLHERPIIAGIGSLNEKLGEWLDSVLQPLVCSLLSFLKDTNHLLSVGKDMTWDDNMSQVYTLVFHMRKLLRSLLFTWTYFTMLNINHLFWMFYNIC